MYGNKKVRRRIGEHRSYLPIKNALRKKINQPITFRTTEDRVNWVILTGILRGFHGKDAIIDCRGTEAVRLENIYTPT